MDSIECKVCNCKFPNLKSLHIHIARREKLAIPDYYYKFYPKKDLYTLKPIEYKDHNQYFYAYFNSRKNMVKWLEANQGTSHAADISLKMVENRIKDKSLKSLPSEVELRSASTPSIVGLEKLHNKSYADIVTGLPSKFIYNNINLKSINKNLSILIDTREQQPFSFRGFDSKVSKLDVGDYTCAEPDYDDIFIERKSVDDFFSTFGTESNFKRFEKELNRALEYGLYLFVVVEKDLSECLDFYSHFSSNKYLSEFTFHNVRDIMQKSKNCQFVFARNKEMAQNLTLQMLSNGQSSTKYDWQYLIDKRII